mgnify:CR=1 FL=1
MKKRLLINLSKIFLSFCILIFCFLIIFFCLNTFNINETIPDISNIELYDNKNNKFLSFSHNRKKSYVRLDDVSPYLIDSILTIEDKRFYDHQGVDIVRVGGALVKNIKVALSDSGAVFIKYTRLLLMNIIKKL